jgi:hypothetical protein
MTICNACEQLLPESILARIRIHYNRHTYDIDVTKYHADDQFSLIREDGILVQSSNLGSWFQLKLSSKEFHELRRLCLEGLSVRRRDIDAADKDDRLQLQCQRVLVTRNSKDTGEDRRAYFNDIVKYLLQTWGPNDLLKFYEYLDQDGQDVFIDILSHELATIMPDKFSNEIEPAAEE